MSLDVEEDSKLRESVFLSVLSGFFDTAKSGLKRRDLGIIQGALRTVYNGMGELVYGSEYLSPARKELLEKFGNCVSRIRDDILKAENRNLTEVVGSHNIYGRIESAKAALNRYINYWYNS